MYIDFVFYVLFEVDFVLLLGVFDDVMVECLYFDTIDGINF